MQCLFSAGLLQSPLSFFRVLVGMLLDPLLVGFPTVASCECVVLCNLPFKSRLMDRKTEQKYKYHISEEHFATCSASLLDYACPVLSGILAILVGCSAGSTRNLFIATWLSFLKLNHLRSKKSLKHGSHSGSDPEMEIADSV